MPPFIQFASRKLKTEIGLRVSKQEEEEGLDMGEHGQEAYVGFATPISAATAIREMA
jgi:Amt family ammonium transporter